MYWSQDWNLWDARKRGRYTKEWDLDTLYNVIRMITTSEYLQMNWVMLYYFILLFNTYSWLWIPIYTSTLLCYNISSRLTVCWPQFHRYALRQCYRDIECWCVDPFNGTMIEGSMGPPASVECICECEFNDANSSTICNHIAAVMIEVK